MKIQMMMYMVMRLNIILKAKMCSVNHSNIIMTLENPANKRL